MREYDHYDEAPAMWGEDECLPLDELHPLIGNAARPGLEQRDMAGAIEAAWRVLRDLLRQRLGSGHDGRLLVDAIGQAKNPRLPLTPNRSSSERSQHDGIVHLLRGVVAYVRNPAAHESRNPFAGDRWTTMHLLAVMSLCASHIEDSGTAERAGQAVDILFEPDYPDTREAVEAAVWRVPRHQRSRFVAELLRRIPGASQQIASVFAAYDHVIALHDNTNDVLEAAAGGASHLLLAASTTEAGLRLLAPGVTERLDPAAYAKVRDMLNSVAASLGTSGQRHSDSRASRLLPLLGPERLGRICATLSKDDCTHLVKQLVAALQSNRAAAAYATRALREASHVRGPSIPTGRDVTDLVARGIAGALVGEYASDVAAALFPARSLYPSFRYHLRAALDTAVVGPPSASATVAITLRDELASLDRRRRRSGP